ncbi:MAG TPA: nucleotidyltransferase family protein [Devosia sp.]|nr:nucleotidyltransferase family protein [Devosia sp.]
MTVRDIIAKLRTLTPAEPRGPFPSLAWAWPTGGRDLLLQAAIVADPAAAAAAFHRWYATHDFDGVTFSEQRLLVSISVRLPEGILEPGERNRLLGVERALWTRAMLSFRASAPAFGDLAAAGIDSMILKGAAWSAIALSNLRGRYTDDLDILVRPADFQRAWEVLQAAGWNSRFGATITGRTGVNLHLGDFGRLDLHRFAYHQMVLSEPRREELWERSEIHRFFGHDVRIPSATNRLLMAIAHGGRDGHSHSDWLVDSAHLIRGGSVDWDLFVARSRERGLDPPAAIALGYLAGPLGVAVPAEVLQALRQSAERGPLRLMGALVEGRPYRDHSAVSRLARRVVRAHHRRQTQRVLRALDAPSVGPGG